MATLYEDYYDDQPENKNPDPTPPYNNWGDNGGLAGGFGPWAPSYDPGANFNNGQAPAAPAPSYDYNGGSPPDQALTPGHGWEWQGPQEPVWDMTNNQWNSGVWQEAAGRGLGYQAPAAPAQAPAAPAPSYVGSGGQASSNGAVAPLAGGMPNSGITVPSSTLPPDIASLFSKVPEQTPIQSAYQKALLDFMGRSQKTPSLDDANLGPQTEVYRAASQRGMEHSRKVSAERAAASGRSQSGYLDRQIDKGAQEQAFNTASFNANLLGKEFDKKRQDLNAALQLAAATGDHEAERELRSRLAEVSAAMQQQGLNLQGQLGAGDLALRQLLGQQGNDQFYDALGVNTALSTENLNQNALKLLMGIA